LKGQGEKEAKVKVFSWTQAEIPYRRYEWVISTMLGHVLLIDWLDRSIDGIARFPASYLFELNCRLFVDVIFDQFSTQIKKFKNIGLSVFIFPPLFSVCNATCGWF
jgi:hypothetical protein